MGLFDLLSKRVQAAQAKTEEQAENINKKLNAMPENIVKKLKQ